MRSLAKRFRLNALGYGYAQLVTVLMQLVSVPFFLRAWGTDYYAEWLVLTGIPQLLVIFDFGIGQASANRATMFAGAKNSDAVVCTLQTCAIFLTLICAVLLTLGLLVAQLVDWREILQLKVLSDAGIQTVWTYMMGYLCLNLLSGFLAAWFRASDRAAIGAFLLANRRMIDLILIIAALILGADAATLSRTMFFGQLLAVSILFVVAWRLSLWSVFHEFKATWAEFKAVWKPATASMAIPISQVITLQGGIQVLNHVAGPITIVAFSMARTLMRLIIQAGITINSALSPEISRLYGANKHGNAKRLTARVSALVIALCFFVYFLLIATGPKIIDMWGHGKVSVSSLMLAVVGAHAVLNVIWYVPASLLIATNRHLQVGAVYAISAAATLGAWLVVQDLIEPVHGGAMLLAMPELAVLTLLVIRYEDLRKRFPT